METMVNELRSTYGGAKVFLTGHTGFKGSWMTLWLHALGAHVTGYALAPDTDPSMFDALELRGMCDSQYLDVRDFDALSGAIDKADPDFIFHFAAQPIVRLSYEQPLETIQTNVLGTTHLLEAVRRRNRPCVVVVVTSDKCYENREWVWGYRESDAMGGHDVYSMSKGAAELVTGSYRRSFFRGDRIRVASARAGNVIGGGDWAADRIVPDFVRAAAADRQLVVRNPAAVRPWQHVLEPLSGYLLLGARLHQDAAFAEAWNFGPHAGNSSTVAVLVDELIRHWGRGAWITETRGDAPHEAHQLRLSIDKATTLLGWQPRWGLSETCARTAEWYRAFYDGATNDVRQLTLRQIDEYMA